MDMSQALEDNEGLRLRQAQWTRSALLGDKQEGKAHFAHIWLFGDFLEDCTLMCLVHD